MSVNATSATAPANLVSQPPRKARPRMITAPQMAVTSPADAKNAELPASCSQ